MPGLRLMLACGLSAAALSTAAAAEPLKVVATFSILGDMVAAVGGDRISLTTLVGPDGDAHVYQPTPADARALAAADVVVVNGLGFEGFLDRLTKASGYAGPMVVAAGKVEPIASGEAEEHEEEHEDHAGHDHAAEKAHDDHGAEEAHADHGAEEAHDDHAGHHHGPNDPHAWQSLSNGGLYVTAIADGLCEVDAGGCDIYRANAEAYKARLDSLEADIRKRIGAVPEERRVVVTSHDAFGYFGAAYDVRFVSPQGVSTESEASASEMVKVIESIRETGVRTIFIESISDPRLMEQIASETGVKIGEPLYSDALSPAGGPASTYLDMMKYNADQLIAAMAGEAG